MQKVDLIEIFPVAQFHDFGFEVFHRCVCAAVSYTHLDVYKRQDITVLLALVRLVSLLVHDAAAVRTEQYAGEQAHFIIAVGAVSYTHLDVYKRQLKSCNKIIRKVDEKTLSLHFPLHHQLKPQRQHMMHVYICKHRTHY